MFLAESFCLCKRRRDTRREGGSSAGNKTMSHTNMARVAWFSPLHELSRVLQRVKWCCHDNKGELCRGSSKDHVKRSALRPLEKDEQ